MSCTGELLVPRARAGGIPRTSPKLAAGISAAPRGGDDALGLACTEFVLTSVTLVLGYAISWSIVAPVQERPAIQSHSGR